MSSKTYPQNAHRVGIWNGDTHRPARAATCMNYCTPQSLLHRLLVAVSASDVQHYMYVRKQWHAREPKPCRNNAIGFTSVDLFDSHPCYGHANHSFSKCSREYLMTSFGPLTVRRVPRSPRLGLAPAQLPPAFAQRGQRALALSHHSDQGHALGQHHLGRCTATRCVCVCVCVCVDRKSACRERV